MSSGAGGRRPARRLVVLLALPSLVWLCGILAGWHVGEPSEAAARERLVRQGALVQGALRSAEREAARVATHGRDVSPGEALRTAREGPLASRIEGAGRLGPSGDFEEWSGTPADPLSGTWGSAGQGSEIRVQGIRTRLIARTAPDPRGRRGLASMVLDSTGDLAFAELLPSGHDRTLLRAVEFAATEHDRHELARRFARSPHDFEPSPVASLVQPLTLASGEPVAIVRLEDVLASHRALERRTRGAALAALLFTVLLASMFDWKAARGRVPGMLGALAAVAVGRATLAAARFPSTLLPREIGSPSLYGSPAGWGLLASPADALLTAIAWALGAVVIAHGVRRIALRHPFGAVALAAVACIGSTAGALALSRSLAINARLPLIRLEGLAHSPAQAVLLMGWVLAILASAKLWAVLWTTARLARSKAGGALRGGALPVAFASIPISLLCSTVLLGTLERIAFERLRTEFAPLVLEQSSRRESALVAAVREAAQSEPAADALAAADRGDPYGAYGLWVRGNLFRQGYQSSLDLYGPRGSEPTSSFRFDLPPLSEVPPESTLPIGEEEAAGGPAGPLLKEEEIWLLGAGTQRLLHAEMPVVRNGVWLGTVVGHVLDVPGNVPFLPGIAPYLAALGPGADFSSSRDPSGSPDYVLYDASGAVLVQTLYEAPPPGPALREAGRRQRIVRLRAGQDTYDALPLVQDRRLHLLLLPAKTVLDRLGGFVRLALLVLATSAVVLLGMRAASAGGRATLTAAVRGSFYRKLLISLLAVSMVPLIGLSLFLRGYFQQRSEDALVQDAVRLVEVVRKVVEDYKAVSPTEGDGTSERGAPSPRTREGGPEPLDDYILHWLGRIVGQEILVYEDARLTATSKRELFASGLLNPRLPGDVQREVVGNRRAYFVRPLDLGGAPIPVAYAHLRLPRLEHDTVVAVPLILQQQQAARAVDQVVEMLLLATVGLGAILAAAAAPLARTVAGPVRALVDATARIAAGDYGARLSTRSRDELAELVEGFNSMARALAAQRADLERRRDYMEALLRNATTGVLSTDPEGRIVTLNPAAEALLSSAEGPPRVGQPLARALMRSRELAPLAEAVRRAAAAPSSQPAPEDVDLVRAGRPRRFRLVRVPLPDPDGAAPGALHLVEDVTDLMRSNQLAAWAEMARAIAHEIKNPLTPIQLSTEHMARLLRDRGVLPSREIEACLDTVTKQVRALREIAREFSTYARLPDLAPEPQDLAAFVRDVLAPYRAAHPPGIVFEERCAPAPPVAVDRRVLGRAVVNLVENALQAMTDGGTLTVSVEPLHDEIVLSVADTGPGLDPSVRARLFEPYFSTKSSGTGLGLAIVRRAVEAHRGRIEVHSIPGQGTTFTMYLPVADLDTAEPLARDRHHRAK